MHYQEILGSSVYFENLLLAASQPDLAGENFVLVPPGGMLRQDQFMRLVP
jgi:hypothetical protein